MTESTQVYLNLQSPNISTVVYGVQNDRLTRHIVAQLLDGSAAWSPPYGTSAFIRYLKPDGTAGFYDVDEKNNAAIVISGSTATLTIVEQALTVPGDVYMQLNFYNANNEKLTTFCWILRVQKSVLEDATIVSSDYYNVLSAQIAAVLDAAAAFSGMTASASGLPTGDDPTVTVTGGSGGVPYNLAFGIPSGPVGPAEIPTTTIRYQEGTSATTAPSGTWQTTIPSVASGNYLWTRVTLTYSDNTSAVYYSVARQGVNGSGSPGTALPLMDGAAAVGSGTDFAREDHVHPSDTSRATKTDFTSFTVTLAAASWSSNQQTVSNAAFITSGYAYIVSPASASFAAYGEAEIYADNVGTSGQMTFHCVNVPSVDLTVNIVRVVSA